MRKHVEQDAASVLVSFLTVATLFLKLNADNQGFDAESSLFVAHKSSSLANHTRWLRDVGR